MSDKIDAAPDVKSDLWSTASRYVPYIPTGLHGSYHDFHTFVYTFSDGMEMSVPINPCPGPIRRLVLSILFGIKFKKVF